MSWQKLFSAAVRIGGVGMASAIAYGAYLTLADFTPHKGELIPNLIGLGRPLYLALLAVYLLATSIGFKTWSSIAWTARSLILFLAYVGWRYFAFATWREGLVFAALVAFAFVLQHVAHRLALGWVIDRNGERQKVDHRSRGYAIFTPTTHSQRITEEATARDKRRKAIAWLSVIGGPLAYFTYRQVEAANWVLAVFLGFLASFALFPWLGEVLTELLYQTGWQDMHGAKVLDPEPFKPGLRDVVNQKAHGDASVASEQDAHAFLKGGR